MANIRAIQAVGEALRVYLQSTYPAELRTTYPCTFQVLSSGELSRFEDPTESSVALTWYLYRVTISEHARSRFQPGFTPPGAQPALPVELHWMMTVWAASAAAEHTVFAWALRQLDLQQVLDTSVLPDDADWDRAEALQLLPEELPIEDISRIWDVLEPSYRLSTCYVTRVVRLDRTTSTPLPVIATRISVGGRSEGGEP